MQESTSYGNLAWKVKGKAFLWERPLRQADREALGDEAPTGTVLAAAVEDEGAKQALLANERRALLTTPHFDGYPVVLVRLEAVGSALLEELVTDAWLAKAPRRLAERLLAER